ncbi:MAG: hypothetical protein ACQCN4_00760 [Candidatus Bathyarchaeia archaeon]|jgi:hypothetical protein
MKISTKVVIFSVVIVTIILVGSVYIALQPQPQPPKLSITGVEQQTKSGGYQYTDEDGEIRTTTEFNQIVFNFTMANTNTVVYPNIGNADAKETLRVKYNLIWSSGWDYSANTVTLYSIEPLSENELESLTAELESLLNAELQYQFNNK